MSELLLKHQTCMSSLGSEVFGAYMRKWGEKAHMSCCLNRPQNKSLSGDDAIFLYKMQLRRNVYQYSGAKRCLLIQNGPKGV